MPSKNKEKAILLECFIGHTDLMNRQRDQMVCSIFGHLQQWKLAQLQKQEGWKILSNNLLKT